MCSTQSKYEPLQVSEWGKNLLLFANEFYCIILPYFPLLE